MISFHVCKIEPNETYPESDKLMETLFQRRTAYLTLITNVLRKGIFAELRRMLVNKNAKIVVTSEQ